MIKSQIKQIIENYELGGLQNYEELSPGYANRNYRVETSSGVILLRWVLEKNIQDIQKELDLLLGLKSVKFPTAYPISKKDGKHITELSVGFVVLYDFIQGQHPDLGTAQAHSIGEALGKLSVFKPPKDFKRANTINLEGCINLAQELDAAASPIPDIFRYFKNQTEFFKTHVDIGLPKGLIHADIFPDNTIFDGENLKAIIDFEEACWDELIFDLSMAINGFCFPKNKLSYNFLESIINGYLMHRKLTPEEWEALPIYIAWTAHGMLSWHLERLSQIHSERQENRVRELMSRVVDILDREVRVSQSIRTIRETI